MACSACSPDRRHSCATRRCYHLARRAGPVDRPQATRSRLREDTSSSRPYGSLLLTRHGAEPFVDELLQTLSFVGFRGVEVALRVHGDAVHGVELPRLASTVAEAGELFERIAAQDADLHVVAVGHVQIRLRRILGEREVEHGAVAEAV